MCAIAKQELHLSNSFEGCTPTGDENNIGVHARWRRTGSLRARLQAAHKQYRHARLKAARKHYRHIGALSLPLLRYSLDVSPAVNLLLSALARTFCCFRITACGFEFKMLFQILTLVFERKTLFQIMACGFAFKVLFQILAPAFEFKTSFQILV